MFSAVNDLWRALAWHTSTNVQAPPHHPAHPFDALHTAAHSYTPVPQVLAIVSEKQREVNLSLGHIYSSLLNKALQQDGGAMLDLLLQRIHWEPQSVTFSGLNLVHPGAIKEVAAHLPKLLEVGLPPDCRVGGGAGLCCSKTVAVRRPQADATCPVVHLCFWDFARRARCQRRL
jgi:hypothetical protein